MAATLLTWSCFSNVAFFLPCSQHLWWTPTLCAGHQNYFWLTSEPFLCLCSMFSRRQATSQDTMSLPQCVLVFPGPWQVTLCARWFHSGLVQFLHLQQQPSVLTLFQSETLVSSHWSMKLLQDVSRNVLLVVCPADLISGSANETKAFTNPGLYPVHTNA